MLESEELHPKSCTANCYFLAHLSWKLSSSELFWSPVVRASVRKSVNFYIFDFSSRTTGPILTRLGTDHVWGEGFQVCSNEGDYPSPRGDNSESVKIHWKLLKIFFFRTSRPNPIKLGTNYPLVKGIQFCSNKGPGLLQRGGNFKNVKMGLGHLKIFFSRTTLPILTRFGTNHPWG
jgi:hypothetical protein